MTVAIYDIGMFCQFSDFIVGGNIQTRIEGFGIKYFKCITTDINLVYNSFSDAISFVREKRLPVFIECITHRFSGHSKSDKREYIPKELDEFWLQNDFLTKLEASLSLTVVDSIKTGVEKEISNAINITLETK